MVDRVRNEYGDPRYYLVELRKNNSDDILKGLGDKVVFLHRLPHMKMKSRTYNCINTFLFLIVISMAFTWNITKLIFFVMSTLLACLDNMIIPGMLFYYHSKENWLKEEVDVR